MKGKGERTAEGAGRTGAWRTVYWTLMFLPLAVTAAALTVLPDQVPMHYDLAEEIDRWGSKYENLILPVMVLVIGGAYRGAVWLVREQTGKENAAAVQRLMGWIGCGMLFVFNVMTL